MSVLSTKGSNEWGDCEVVWVIRISDDAYLWHRSNWIYLTGAVLTLMARATMIRTDCLFCTESHVRVAACSVTATAFRSCSADWSHWNLPSCTVAAATGHATRRRTLTGSCTIVSLSIPHLDKVTGQNQEFTLILVNLTLKKIKEIYFELE